MAKKLLVTHHAPDLDAIGAVWVLKRFESKKYADAKIAFVNPGEKISIEVAQKHGFELHNVVHVDTGLGRFDHHQPDRAMQMLSATKLVYDHVCSRNSDLEKDEALQIIAEFVTEIDHFQEIHWPDSGHYRYSFMIHELIKGIEFTHPHDDDSQMYFGLQCLDAAYATLTQQVKAREIIEEKGEKFTIGDKECLALATRNDDTLKIAQKQGYELVIRKDTKLGNIRVKVRPDSSLNLQPLYDKVLEKDSTGTWFFHGSGKMLINGSKKHKSQKPSPLSLEEIIQLAKESLKD